MASKTKQPTLLQNFWNSSLAKWASVATIVACLIAAYQIYSSKNTPSVPDNSSTLQTTNGNQSPNINGDNNTVNNTDNSNNQTMNVTNSGTMGDVVNGDKTEGK